MGNYSKYDLVLTGIALTIIAMLSGLFVGPVVTITSGILGAALVGVAMFAIAPVPSPKVLSNSAE